MGNNPDVDYHIITVTLTLKQVKNVEKLLELEKNIEHRPKNGFVFQYEFLGSSSHTEILLNDQDCYTINEKVTLTFKSSLQSLRLYFQRIFYIPINLMLNGVAIGK